MNHTRALVCKWIKISARYGVAVISRRRCNGPSFVTEAWGNRDPTAMMDCQIVGAGTYLESNESNFLFLQLTSVLGMFSVA